MKGASLHSQSNRGHSSARGSEGAALVAVLAMIVLILGLVVAFLSLAKTERQSASTFLARTEVHQLADNAVGVVQSQINFATSRGSSVAWASQPGMIRTYSADGSFKTAYKLYSAKTLTINSAALLGDDLPEDSHWPEAPAHWTDLNAPVAADGRDVYPIIDPSLLDVSSRPMGFEITSDAPVASDAGRDRAPLPVRWLYVLKNGEIVAPGNTGTTVATLAEASEENPVIGRIAFWTDDETCKVNLNTAGAGGFWDVPRYDSREERKFATSQPLNGEFQRYPGHPAMTSLNAVFPELSDNEILTDMLPRYQWGGSEQGTVDTYKETEALNSGVFASRPLFASVDEFRFKPSHDTREKNTLVSAEKVDSSRFFLTSVSRAPEVNLFNLPRITCWPVSTDTDKRTAFDKLISFSGTIGGLPYYFQRENALSPTVDSELPRNADLFAYLQHLTDQKIPGFGVKLADKFGIDRDQILTEVWDYIRCTNLYDSRLGLGKQFTSDKNSRGYGYVVPLETGSGASLSQGFGRSITLSELAFVFICSADPVDTETGNGHPDPKGLRGSNDPISNLTLGGTALTPTQRRLQMIIVPELFSPSQGNIRILPKNIRLSISGLDGLALGGQALFPTAMASIDIGTAIFNNGIHTRALGGTFDYRAAIFSRSDPGILDSATSTSQVYPFISNFVTVSVPDPGSENPGVMGFASNGLTVTIETSEDGATWRVAQVIPINPPASSSIPIPNLVRTGVAAYSGASASTATNEKYWWAFSNTSPTGSSGGGRLSQLNKIPGEYKISNSVPLASTAYAGTLFREAESATYYTDVVRSMVPSHGDIRLVAALRNVPSDAFTPLGNWGAIAAANAIQHNLSVGVQSGVYIPGGTQLRRHFVTTNTIGSAAGGAGGRSAPDFRRDASVAVLDAVQNTGDFDNASSLWADGPYINKPDEGNIYSSTSTDAPYFKGSESEEFDSKAFFSPNRMMAGPGMFGSLPTHVKRYAADSAEPEKYAWKTLLFRMQPGHPNAVTTSSGGLPSSAPDHLLMDLFWMPVVEPYALSEPFSTAGKINMNYQIQPFSYIKRSTGLYAVLQKERLSAVPNSASSVYKDYGRSVITPTIASFRLPIDVSQTLAQFESRFEDASGRLFISPTELCDLWLVPQDESISSLPAFWEGHSLTGDNMRERPYTTIIPRLTTKSNTFTVHFRVQSLKAPKSGDPAIWDETKGTVTSEYRGSTTIERFIDTGNATLGTTDFATETASRPTLDKFYRWRVIQNRQFAP